DVVGVNDDPSPASRARPQKTKGRPPASGTAELPGRSSRVQSSDRIVAASGRTLLPSRFALSDDGRKVACPGRFRTRHHSRSAIRARLPPARQDVLGERRLRLGPRRLRNADEPAGERPRNAPGTWHLPAEKGPPQ